MGRDKYMHFDYKELLGIKESRLTCGIEIEVYLLDENDSLINDIEVTEELLENLPDTITKDYYPYQLEIRTKPHKNPETLLNELKENIAKCNEECVKRNLKMRFNSWLGNDEMFNGLHFHIRYLGENQFLNTIMNSYPLILSIASFFRCSPGGFNLPSNRLDCSQHCGLPSLDSDVLENPSNSNRYKDIVINQYKNNNRHRLKSVNTLEIRLFDVPCDWEYLKLLVHLLYNTYSHLKKTKPLIDNKNKKDINWYFETATITRNEICSCRHTFNYFLNDFNDSIIMKLINLFKIKTKIDENLFSFVDESPLDYEFHIGYPFIKRNKKQEKESKKGSKSGLYGHVYGDLLFN